MPYPEHWPLYCPAQKLGDWLEWYYSAMELYAWCNSYVTGAQQHANGEWTLKVNRNGKGEREVNTKHIVMATSLCGLPNMPKTPGEEVFKGTVRHSTQHDSSKAWIGKKVLVVGTSSSGMDSAYDFARRGIDVTLCQRSPTYIMSLEHAPSRALGLYIPKDGKRPDLEETDRIAYALPVSPQEELGRRMTQELKELDKPLLDGLEKKGFWVWDGQKGAGSGVLGYTRNGPFYFDAGACGAIIDGRIKMEHGYVDHFTKDKVVLNGNREQEYDLVVMATGFAPVIDSIRDILGEDVAKRVKPIWGIDEEGELNSAWRENGVPNFWIHVGTLQHGRYHSKKIALRIKAQLEGIAEKPYLV